MNRIPKIVYPRRKSLLFSPISLLKEVGTDIWSQSNRVGENLKFLYAVQDAVLHGGSIDDRKYLVERIIQIAASLPNDSHLRGVLNTKFIHSLWTNLQHPPLSYLGNAYKYRTADGSNNNITYSKDSAILGVAGSRYAQTVPPMHPPRKLPPPGEIFDKLMARKGEMKVHPTQVSSSLFHFATIITHDIFNTNFDDSNKSDTSSYVDLSPLYGSSEKELEGVRDSEGKLKPDTFADSRFLIQPPGVCALLIAFNRFHNYVAQELAVKNEDGRFSIPAHLKQGDPKYDAAKKKREDDLFQTARLVTCGLYVNIIMNDYLRTILNLNRNPVKSDWKLDPRGDGNDVFDKEGTPRGIGNQVSVEFNVIYRWHSCISAQDEQWINDKFSKLLSSKGDTKASPMELYRDRFKVWKDDILKQPPQTWTFEDLVRKSDGSFDSDELVKILRRATDNVAGSFGARNIPQILKPIEVQGIERGRKWGLTSLNEFRNFFNLASYRTFQDVNPDEEIAKSLEELYEHPDNIELYPGLIAEATKEAIVPGSGLCPGFTTSYAILSDAVALVRGDRFYAVDFNPQNLTRWGFDAVSSDFNVAGGGLMHKLYKIAFPDLFTANSVYAKYPFTTPKGNEEITDKDVDTSEPKVEQKKLTSSGELTK